MGPILNGVQMCLYDFIWFMVYWLVTKKDTEATGNIDEAKLF